MILWALAVLLAAGPVAAQDLPAAYDVTGVAANDVLNIRAQPSPDAEVLRELGPHVVGVEVLALSDDRKWGLVAASGEGNGWVAMCYLQPQPEADPTTLPRPLTCMGTEPFWSLTYGEKHDEYLTPDDQSRPLTMSAELIAPQGYFVLAQDESGRNYQSVITREQCNDGMSDRQFGFSIRMFLAGKGDGNQVLSGCCTLDHSF